MFCLICKVKILHQLGKIWTKIKNVDEILDYVGIVGDFRQTKDAILDNTFVGVLLNINQLILCYSHILMNVIANYDLFFQPLNLNTNYLYMFIYV